MLSGYESSWCLVVNSSFQEEYGTVCLQVLFIFINDQDSHTEEPQEVQQREMPNPVFGIE